MIEWCDSQNYSRDKICYVKIHRNIISGVNACTKSLSNPCKQPEQDHWPCLIYMSNKSSHPKQQVTLYAISRFAHTHNVYNNNTKCLQIVIVIIVKERTFTCIIDRWCDSRNSGDQKQEIHLDVYSQSVNHLTYTITTSLL